MNIKLRIFFVASIISFQTIASPIQFEDTSDKLGFTRGTETWGIAWGNLNMDEFPDLWNSGHRDLPRLYQNAGNGDFDDVAMEYDLAMNGLWLNNVKYDAHGGAWGDFDNDGDDDLIIGDERDLYTNQATTGGYFVKSNISTPQQWAGWSNTDSDRDLEVDLTCSGGSQYMLLFDLDNDGDAERVCGDEGTFPDSVNGASSSLIPPINGSNDAAIGDFNNDLRTDIIVTRGSLRPNDAKKVDNNRIEAWFRDGIATQFTFSAQGEVVFLIDGLLNDSGSGYTGPYDEATRFVLNTNGTNSASARRVSISYQSGLWTVSFTGNGQAYVRIKAQSLVSEPVMAGLGDPDKPQATYHGVNTPSGIDWVFSTGLYELKSCGSVVAADFDNDMDIDLYMACRTGVANVSNRYFDNDGDGSFTEVSLHGGEGPVGVGTEFGVAESVVTADYDVDGFMDLAVSNGLLYYPYGFGGPDTLIRNKGNGNHWIELDLIGTISPRAAIGAKIYLTAGGITQLREQSAGYHRWSQNHSRIHFGLAGNTAVDEVRIVWPTGQEQSFFNIAADTLYNVEENGNIIPADLTTSGPVTIEPGEECGQPPYNSRLGPVLQVWRECGTDDWRMRVNGGLGRLTEHRDLIAEGVIVGEPVKFGYVSGTSTDGTDIVDSSINTLIDFKLTVQDDKTNQKGINFNNAGQTSTCLSLEGTTNDFERAYIGSAGKRISLPFDLKTLNSCLSITANNKTVSEDAGFVEVQVNLAVASAAHITVDYQTVGNSATSGLDYSEVSGQLIFYPGETQKTIEIPIIQDFLFEGEENFVVQFTSGQIASLDNQITVTIEDDDTTSSNCGEPTIDGATERGVFLWKDCAGGDAWYVWATAGNGPALTYVGSLSSNQTFSAVAKRSFEPSDVLNSTAGMIDFQMTISSPWYDSFNFQVDPGNTCLTLDTPAGLTVLVGENKVPVSSPFNIETLGSCGSGLSIADANVSEAGGTVDVEVSLSSPASQVVTVAYQTVNGTATSGADYSPVSGTLTFAVNEISETISIPILQDSSIENVETFTVQLSSAANALITDGVAVVSITDDEASACGEPAIDGATDRALFLWQDCSGDDTWYVWTTAGTGAALTYSGDLAAFSNFSAVAQRSFESSDILDSGTPGVIDFQMTVTSPWYDSFSFQVGPGSTCLTLDTAGTSILVGANKAPVSSPFDIKTLGPC